MRTLSPKRLRTVLISAIFFIVICGSSVFAQDDPGDRPLGDVARSFRKKPIPSEAVIDNDNFSKIVDDAAVRRAAGAAPLFSLDSTARSVRATSPDVTCSLSFTKTASPFSDPLLLDELPRTELEKLEGPATIEGDSLQVSMHNGTSWEVREVVIGLTIVKRPDPSNAAATFGKGRVIPASEVDRQTPQDSFQKRPDVTLLLRVKGSAAPLTTATFRTSLNFALFPDQEWHWAIVKAKGIPPQIQDPVTQAEQNAIQFPLPSPDPSTPGTPLNPLSADPSSLSLHPQSPQQ